jgi:hypothetical protein
LRFLFSHNEGRLNKEREPDAHLHQQAGKGTHVPFFVWDLLRCLFRRFSSREIQKHHTKRISETNPPKTNPDVPFSLISFHEVFVHFVA